MNEKSLSDPTSITLRFSYDEYISNPLTLEQLGLYEAQRLRCRAYEKELLSRHLMISGFVGLGCIVLLDLIHTPPAITLALGFTVTIAMSLATVFLASQKALNKHPMALWVGNQNWIRGTSGREFEQVSVRTEKYIDSDAAQILSNNILNQGRGICEFEQYIIRRIAIADRMNPIKGNQHERT